ncbi:hypothetical protein CIW83_09670 [Tissierella sp. P1]|uniref:phage major capsid protein n=1 Tax=Tissierella sp. P1 TaxID=1280483 RepID=UPI000BA0BEB7|nr:hypothetical protein [Tissierella sp. P1]OZV12355.1 hypothetical protein CIW83_09670 [Tissierella sp. P1]
MKFTLNNLKPEMYQEAFKQNMTLSMYLETLNPSSETDQLDAFERLMKEAGILTKSVPSRNMMASTVEAFYRTNENKVLFPEYVARTLVRSMTEYPLYKHLVGVRTGIEGSVYEASYLDLNDAKNKKALEMRRVAEGADLPKAVLKLGESVIKLYKYGRAVGISYEALRRTSLEIFQRHINLIGIYAAMNKTNEILDVIKNGDGNNNAAQVIKSSDISTGTTNLTRDVFIDFMLSFEDVGGANTVIANKKAFMQILDILYPTMENAGQIDQMIKQGLGISVNMPQNLISDFTLLYSPRIDKVNNAEAIYALNKENTIEEVYELNSTIKESDINIINQTKEMTVSENSGFRKIFKESAKILTLN